MELRYIQRSNRLSFTGIFLLSYIGVFIIPIAVVDYSDNSELLFEVFLYR